MEFIDLVPAEMPFELMGRSFRDWFRRAPWLEVARCPSCGSADDFGSAGRYASFGDGLCLRCGTPLEGYWSDERVKRYFDLAVAQPGFIGYVGKDERGGIVAWTWGYGCHSMAELQDQPQRGFYVDTFGFVPPHGAAMMELFRAGHHKARQKGVPRFYTRTHRKAQYVKDAITRFGYRFLKVSEQEEDREYWVYQP